MRTFLPLALALISCGPALEREADEAEPRQLSSSSEQGLVTCAEVPDSGVGETDPNVVPPVPVDAVPTRLELEAVRGGCSAAPGLWMLGVLLWARRRS